MVLYTFKRPSIASDVGKIFCIVMKKKKKAKKQERKDEYIIENGRTTEFSLVNIPLKSYSGNSSFFFFFLSFSFFLTSVCIYIFIYIDLFYFFMFFSSNNNSARLLHGGRRVGGIITVDLLPGDNSLVHNCTARMQNGRKCTRRVTLPPDSER